jgi:hypothetical protein
MSTLFDISRLRWPAPNMSVVFSDESSQGEDFFVLGGLYFWHPSNDYKNQIATFESDLQALKTGTAYGWSNGKKFRSPVSS